jgi:hypothetical protein
MHFLVEDFSLDMPERVVVDASLPDPWNSKILISSFTIQLVGYASRTVQFQDQHNYFLVVYKRCSYYFITAEIFKFLSSSISLLLFVYAIFFILLQQGIFNKPAYILLTFNSFLQLLEETTSREELLAYLFRPSSTSSTS